MERLTAGAMRKIEAEAIGSGRVTGLELMERAGRGVVEAIFEEWPDLADVHAQDRAAGRSGSGKDPGPSRRQGGGRAVVLCGPGNNGGDGFVVARLLQERGWDVDVYLYGEIRKLPPDACTNCDRWLEIGEVRQVREDLDERAFSGAALVVDALFGTGLTRPLENLSSVLSALVEAARLFAQQPQPESESFATRVVAVDIPSGIHTDTGLALTPSHGGCGAARANLTVTFHRAKFGHTRGDGPDACGTLVIKDIGL